jgi:ABC-type lipoprotein release transport system permease subunit
VSAADPVIYACVIIMVPAVALLASYIPARRAAQADPMQTLRAE